MAGQRYLMILIPLFSVWLPSAWTGFNSSAYALKQYPEMQEG
jgi:hypothetical protein